MLAPVLEQFARKTPIPVKLASINIDDEPEFTSKFAIRGLPTLLLFNNGQVVDRLTGLQRIEAITAWIDAKK